MTTRDIRTSHETTVCDVCGRSLLRGEHAEIFINGGARHSVCELCKGRALHEGWIREGTLPEYDGGSQSSERRRSLFGRLRHRREASTGSTPSLDEELSAPWSPPPSGPAAPPIWPAVPGPSHANPREGIEAPPSAPPPDVSASEEAVPRRRGRPARPPRTRVHDERERERERRSGRESREGRDPRHVRAVPTRDEQKIAAAITLFNESEHRRTVSGVARSLGLPMISVLPDHARPSLVRLVVSWELSWYRYEVDLSDEIPAVRVEEQGYELAELAERERMPNAMSDETGRLSLP